MNQVEARVKVPPKLKAVFTGEAMYRGAYGGRGSGKTRTFAKMTAIRAYMWAKEGRTGVIVCAREFMNSLADSSMAEVKAAILSEPWLAAHFDIGETYIRTKDGRIDYVFCGMRHNLDSIKSKALILLLWVDEAETVTDSAWSKADNTVREVGSETWVTWNPEIDGSATDKRFRKTPPPQSKIVELNHRDNPWFHESTLPIKMQADMDNRPEQVDHIWEGGYKTHNEGAYFAKGMNEAKAKGRIAFLPRDPLMTLRAYWDIGGTGMKADACAIWIQQHIGLEIRNLDYYEAVGQELSTHVQWMHDNGYEKALCILPHDGKTNDKVFRVSYESALRSAGFVVRTVPNMGEGAAMIRVKAVQRVMPAVTFHSGPSPDGERLDATKAGRFALGWYHEKRDEKRNIGLGPHHDWSSHGADAFGLAAVDYEQHKTTAADNEPIQYKRLGHA